MSPNGTRVQAVGSAAVTIYRINELINERMRELGAGGPEFFPISAYAGPSGWVGGLGLLRGGGFGGRLDVLRDDGIAFDFSLENERGT